MRPCALGRLSGIELINQKHSVTPIYEISMPMYYFSRRKCWPDFVVCQQICPVLCPEMRLRISSKAEASAAQLRWLATATALFIGIVIAANGLLLLHLRKATIANVQTDLLRQSLTLSEIAERTFQSTSLVLASLAEKLEGEDLDIGQEEQLKDDKHYLLLRAAMAGLPQINNIGITDANGRRMNWSHDWPSRTFDLSDREYFRVLKQNPTINSFIAEPVQGRSTGDWEIMVSRPLVGKNGEFLGVVYASTLLRFFEDLFRATSLGNGYAASLMRRDGTLLARHPKAGRIGQVAPVSTLKIMGDSNSAVSRAVSPIDKQARIAAAYRLASYPLVIVTSQEESAALADWRRAALVMSLITAVIVLITVVAAYLLARSWKQQASLNMARAELIASERSRTLAEADLSRERELAKYNQRFTAAVENIKQGLCMFDADQRLVISNAYYARMYRLPSELAKPGTPYQDIIAYCTRSGVLNDGGGTVIDGGDSASAGRKLRSLAELSTDKNWILLDRHSDGKVMRIIHQPMEGGGWVATHEDITERQQAEQELEDTKRFLDSIIRNIPIAVVVKDAESLKYVLVNQAFEEMIGVPAGKLLGRVAFDIHKAEDAALIDRADRQALENGETGTFNETRLETRTRGSRVHMSRRIIMRGNDGKAKYIIAVIEDVTERKQAEQRIAYLAHHDALTGLTNRVALVERIEEALARQRRRADPFSVLLLDLDRFKYVNDTLGHPAGDALLREVAIRLKGILRESDVLARLGGDEFAIIQSRESDQRAAATALAKRILDALEKPFAIDAGEVMVGTSIGIVLAPEHASTSESVLKMADLALYQVKATGRNGFCFFEPEMGTIATARHAVEADLRRAIEQGELALHYQPIIDARTRKICSVEALVRWRHPTKGLILPDQFIPLAEETGLISRISEWVLQTAFAEAVNWPGDIKIAVNISPLQFRNANLQDVVLTALADTRLPPERLEVEITETALIESAVECLPVLRRFKNLGITIVLDDFGTGYSSLSYLASFRFDKIKIDKSFTQNLTKRSECAAIIAATLHLSHSLNMATTAEGVETIEQYRILKLAGVTSVQGYLFKRPGPASELDFASVYGGLDLEDAA